MFDNKIFACEVNYDSKKEFELSEGEQMKKIFDFVGGILYIGMIIWDVIEFLAFPVLFLVIGLLNSHPWQYYAIAIGGYFALFIILEIILHFIFKAFNKKYMPFIERKLEKHFNKFEKYFNKFSKED